MFKASLVNKSLRLNIDTETVTVFNSKRELQTNFNFNNLDSNSVLVQCTFINSHLIQYN